MDTNTRAERSQPNRPETRGTRAAMDNEYKVSKSTRQEEGRDEEVIDKYESGEVTRTGGERQGYVETLKARKGSPTATG